MKKYKIFLVLMTMVVACSLMCSCGDDKDEPQNPMLGAWELVPDQEKMQQIEQELVAQLAQAELLNEQTIDILTRVKEIVASLSVVVQFNADGTARLYSYRSSVGVFVTGTWTITGQALILQVGTLQLPVTNLVTDGNTLQCNIGDLQFEFIRYEKR